MPGQKVQDEKGTQARSILKVRNVVKELKSARGPEWVEWRSGKSCEEGAESPAVKRCGDRGVPSREERPLQRLQDRKGEIRRARLEMLTLPHGPFGCLPEPCSFNCIRIITSEWEGNTLH